MVFGCTTGGKILARYTHGPGIDEPLGLQQGTKNYYDHADGLGSIVALSNSTGKAVQLYRYDAFGRMTQSGSVTQPYTYTAREYDTETGLYYYRARYYDPKAGRFLQRDPIGFRGGINQYAYVNNNPVNRIDPSGLIDSGIDPSNFRTPCMKKCGINCANKASKCVAGPLGYGVPTCSVVCVIVGGKWLCAPFCAGYAVGGLTHCYIEYENCIRDCDENICVCRDPI